MENGEAPGPASGALDLPGLFRLMVDYGASDLHLKAGNPPLMRVKGRIRTFDSPPLDAARIDALLAALLSPEQRATFARERDLDFAHHLEGAGRFRVNVFRQRGATSVAARRVPEEIPSFEQLNLAADAMRRIASLRQGLVILAGTTGSGKSTTLAAMVDFVNSTRRCHVVTIEDPIEFLHEDKKAFVNQREVGLDVASFHAALRAVVRQDPDVILIGEMRDEETFETALTAAETGHLVFGTVHASTCAQTIGRIVDLFPTDRQRQIRQALRFSLRAVVCQQMLPSTKPEVGQVPCQEILIVTPSVQKVIIEAEDKKLETIIRGGADDGMQDMNQSLLRLVRAGLVSEKDALDASPAAEQLAMNLKGIFLGDDRKITSS